MIIYNIYKYTTHPFGHLKDLGSVAYKLSPTQRQNRASLLPIRAHERPEVEEMTAYRGQHTNESRKSTPINNEPWFVGKDVAQVLGYENQNRDIQRHVEEEDRVLLDEKTQYQNGIEFDYKALGQRGGWLINESGLYSLIFSSKLPEK